MAERVRLGGCVTVGIISTIVVSGVINKVSEIRAADFHDTSGTMGSPPTAESTPFILPTMTAISVPSCRPPTIYSRDADIRDAGKYYFSGELDSYPLLQDGVRANYYGGGERLNVHTATGEIFNSYEMAAASWFYPLGTQLDVTWQGNTVRVRVWDRGPNRVEHPDVYIDLTRGAMVALTGQASSAYGVSIRPVCP